MVGEPDSRDLHGVPYKPRSTLPGTLSPPDHVVGELEFAPGCGRGQ